MEMMYFSEMSVVFQRRYIPEDRTLHNDRCGNLTSFKFLYVCRKKGDGSWDDLDGMKAEIGEMNLLAVITEFYLKGGGELQGTEET
jgi:hypothetical protein